MKSVYLAGGMKGNWQDVVKELVPNNIYYDPRSHKLDDPKEYTEWDLKHVEDADIIFAYMETSNPSGYGMCIEIGWTYNSGKTIIFVNERVGRKWDMVNECCNYVTDNFEDGIQHLREITQK